MRRHFLGWDRPGLTSVADFLVERYASGRTLDLGAVVVVFPGARAGRRFLEVLVATAEERSLRLVPPRITTTGGLPDVLFEPERPAAGELLQLAVWAESLRESDAGELSRLLSAPPEEGDFAGWLSLAELLRRVERELAGEGLVMADVAERGRSLETFRDSDRWLVLSSVQNAYLRRLEELGYCDPQHARLEAVSARNCRSSADIVLAGTSDMSAVLRKMLDQVAPRVNVLVFAPESLARRFDRHGAVNTAEWKEARVAVPAGAIALADHPANQAARVLDAIRAYGGRYSADEITIGIPDDEVVPYLEQAMRPAGLPLHLAAGTPLKRSPPYRLLEAVGAYLEGKRFRDLAALVRHPDVEAWIEERGSGRRAGDQDLLSHLDRYLSDHLQEDVSERWVGSRQATRPLRGLHAAVEKLLRNLCGPPRPLGEWARPILELILEIYDRRPLERKQPEDRRALDVFEAIRAMLEEMHGLDGRAAPSVGAADALRIALGRIASVGVPPPPGQAAIEALGWLELPLDDAPALIVTSFNEGCVPRTLRADPFLPESLRRHLGLLDNDRRYARDAFALSAILASREDVKLIVGRRRADSDPLKPSRLLFACGKDELVERVRLVFSAEEPEPPAASSLRPGRAVLDFPVPVPPPEPMPLPSMRVTAFRDYLTCPFGYYLRHILGLEALDDSEEELDSRAFGDLAHDVLKEFASGKLRGSTDADAIARELDRILDRLVGERYGRRARPAVLLQVEQLRTRLQAFAAWQASWARQGWRIERAEFAVEGDGAELVVDGQPVRLRGRIDRIDLHRESGERILFDYKTSESGWTPERTHRSSDGEWIDLQLPLYRHLARADPLEIGGAVGLGYIVLPGNPEKVGHHLAGWSDAELESADEKARWVVRRIRQGEFDPAAKPLSPVLAEYTAIYQEGLIVPDIGERSTYEEIEP